MIAIVAVTQDDIDRGVPADACHCPIALALERMFRLRDDDVFVGDTTVMFADDPAGQPAEPDLPLTAQAFVAEFDAGHHVEPFTFKVDVPDTLAGAA